MIEQAGAELGQAQPELGFGENDLGLRGYIQGLGWIQNKDSVKQAGAELG